MSGDEQVLSKILLVRTPVRTQRYTLLSEIDLTYFPYTGELQCQTIVGYPGL